MGTLMWKFEANVLFLITKFRLNPVMSPSIETSCHNEIW